MDALVILGVALGGFIGAPMRYVVDRLVADHLQGDLPIGTFVINMSGSFLLGILAGLGLRGNEPLFVNAIVGTGFCGAYTTFSTWSYETVRLVEERRFAAALTNAIVSLVIGLAAAAGGIVLGSIR